MVISDYLNVATDGFTGLTVTVTKPDNTTETLGPYRTDSTGSTGGPYTPNTVGTYYFQVNFPEQWYICSTADVLYNASSSEKHALTVQKNQYPTINYTSSNGILEHAN